MDASPVEISRYRGLVLWAVALGVQAFMSWDGGCTQITSKALQDNGWSAFELGIVMAVDRFPGVVLFAPIWGKVLDSCPSKPWLMLAIFCKALSCLLFGGLPSQMKLTMIGVRFSMGVWEALFSVWVLAWVAKFGNAFGRKDEVSWRNYISMAAGTGSGLGGLTSGALGQRYGQAYEAQAACLLLTLVVVTIVPKGWLSSRSEEAPPGDAPAEPLLGAAAQQASTTHSILSHEASAHPLLRQKSRREDCSGVSSEDGASDQSLRTLLSGEQGQLWTYTCVASCCSTFTQVGFQSLWQNTATRVWAFPDLWASVTQCVLGLISGVAGMQYIEGFVAKSGTPLQSMFRLSCIAAIAGTLGACFLALKTQTLVHFNMPGASWGGILGIMLLSIAALNFTISGLGGPLGEANKKGVRPGMMNYAAGWWVMLQNCIGFGMGAFVPYSLTGLFSRLCLQAWPEINPEALDAASYTFSMCCVFLSSWLMAGFIGCSCRYAHIK